MPKFIDRMMRSFSPDVHKQPTGKLSVMTRMSVPGGKSFWVVREDIFRKGLERRHPKEAA